MPLLTELEMFGDAILQSFRPGRGWLGTERGLQPMAGSLDLLALRRKMDS
ncbi:MAG TPA: hypothetical protein VMV89_05160 [Candidatus Paceibacterota bacterium]|nr:hypothetical protein [Candidatus Paceibacterota bacterium]